MRWWRAKRKAGAWLALGALLIQLALSFAHIHADDIAGDHALGVTAAVSCAGQQARAPAPASDDHGGAAHDPCAICAVMHFAGALVMPTPPSIAAPAMDDRPRGVAPAAFSPAAPRHALFRSRAPPLA